MKSHVSCVGLFLASLLLASGTVLAQTPTLSLQAVAVNDVAITPSNSATVSPGDTIVAEIFVSDWSPLGERLRSYQTAFSRTAFNSGTSGTVTPVGWDRPITVVDDIECSPTAPPCPAEFPVCQTIFAGVGICVGLDHDPAQGVFIDQNRADWVFIDPSNGTPLPGLSAVDLVGPSLRYGALLINSGDAQAFGPPPKYCGTLKLDVSTDASGTFVFEMDRSESELVGPNLVLIEPIAVFELTIEIDPIDRCGDGVIDAGEACDDGTSNSDTLADACRTDCSLPSCGDNVLDSSEECDGSDSTACSGACRGNCRCPFCGDGVLDPGEACDDGSSNSDTVPDACRTDCVLPRCGDAVVDSSEACDDGTFNSDTVSDACRTDCSLPSCGDNVQDSSEECDGISATACPGACRGNCECPFCGDGILDPGEQCDEGSSNSDTLPDACRTDCNLPTCGDNVVDSGEACDDGTSNSDTVSDACRTDCSMPSCGDHVTDSTEECDDSDSPACPSACRGNCQCPFCGDGILDAGELCDDGSSNSDTVSDACRTDCSLPTCGDEVIDAGEVCDDGSANSNTAPDACRTNCALPTCGDNVKDSAESCDGEDLGDCLGSCADDCACRPVEIPTVSTWGLTALALSLLVAGRVYFARRLSHGPVSRATRREPRLENGE